MARTTSCRSCGRSAGLIRESMAVRIRVLAMQVRCWEPVAHLLATVAGAGLEHQRQIRNRQPRVSRHRHHQDGGIGGIEQACVLHHRRGPELVWLRWLGILRQIEPISVPIDGDDLSSRQLHVRGPRRWSRAQEIRCGPVIEEGLRLWICRDVLSDGPALGTDPGTQRVHLAHGAADLHHVSPATLPAAHGARSFQLLSGLFGRRHGGRAVLSSDGCLPDGSRPPARSDPAATIRQR